MIIDKIQDDIKEYGWHFLFVFNPEQKHSNFGYTIGLEESYGHPEIMIFDLKRETAHGVLTDIVEDVKKGAKYLEGVKLKNLIGGDYEVMFKPVVEPESSEYLGAAIRYYKRPFRAWVLFWPDKNNILPTEDGCTESIQNEALKIV